MEWTPWKLCGWLAICGGILVLPYAGCFRETISGIGDGGDAGRDAGDAGPDGGDAGGQVDAGDAGAINDGGVDAGCLIAGQFYASEAPNPKFACAVCAPARTTSDWSSAIDGTACGNDAGNVCFNGACLSGCLIDGGAFQAGEWESLDVGSCVACTPSMNATAWTMLPMGARCQTFIPPGPPLLRDSGPALIIGGCYGSGLGFGCTASVPGSDCGGDEVGTCLGGFCNDAGPWGSPNIYETGWCEITQNFGGGASVCGYAAPIPPNICAEGPCCLDAGPSNSLFPSGIGWCCGLIDGGVPPCLTRAQVCSTNADCCDGFACTGNDAVANIDGGFGFCR